MLRNPYSPPQNSVLGHQPLCRETEMSYLEPLFFKNKNKEFGFNEQALFLCQLVLMKYRDKIL